MRKTIFIILSKSKEENEKSKMAEKRERDVKLPQKEVKCQPQFSELFVRFLPDEKTL